MILGGSKNLKITTDQFVKHTTKFFLTWLQLCTCTALQTRVLKALKSEWKPASEGEDRCGKLSPHAPPITTYYLWVIFPARV